jgi:hypothetical protein
MIATSQDMVQSALHSHIWSMLTLNLANIQQWYNLEDFHIVSTVSCIIITLNAIFLINKLLSVHKFARLC